MSQDLTVATLPTGSMEAYVGAAFQLPMLTEKEEHDYAVRLRDHQDLKAAQALILAHLRFVVRIARQYSGYGLAQHDLIQEGTVGLMKAVSRFDPDRGVRLVSFAVHWIKAEMHEFILRNWRIVKIATTKEQRKLFFNLRSKKKRLGWFSQEEVQQVADDLGVKPQTVMEMENRLSNYDVTFDAPDNEDEERFISSPSGYLTDKSMGPSATVETKEIETIQQTRLHAALRTLDERSKDILEKRWLADKKATLHELAATYSVSAERIRQIEQNAMKKLQAKMVA